MAAPGRLSAWSHQAKFLIFKVLQLPSKREICVLDLLPVAFDDDVECEIRIVNLDENAEYEALSYCWSEIRHGKTIEVCGKPITVTTNLYAALLRLRYATKKRTLLVDQLCINQWDIKEKAKQVAMMRDIYQKCRHCIL